MRIHSFPLVFFARPYEIKHHKGEIFLYNHFFIMIINDWAPHHSNVCLKHSIMCEYKSTYTQSFLQQPRVRSR